MFKILLIAGLLYLLYRIVFSKPQIPGGKEDKKIDNDKDNDEYVDYEEIE